VTVGREVAPDAIDGHLAARREPVVGAGDDNGTGVGGQADIRIAVGAEVQRRHVTANADGLLFTDARRVIIPRGALVVGTVHTPFAANVKDGVLRDIPPYTTAG